MTATRPARCQPERAAPTLRQRRVARREKPHIHLALREFFDVVLECRLHDRVLDHVLDLVLSGERHGVGGGLLFLLFIRAGLRDDRVAP